MMLNIFKRLFKDALRIDQMVCGDSILQKSTSEQEDIILRLIKNLIEILINFQLITEHFGPTILGEISNTNFMVYLTNGYCLMRKIKKYWLPECTIKNADIESCIDIASKL